MVAVLPIHQEELGVPVHFGQQEQSPLRMHSSYCKRRKIRNLVIIDKYIHIKKFEVNYKENSLTFY